MKLKKEFSDFINLITIDSETNTLIEKRKTLQADIEENLPCIFENHGISLNKSDIPTLKISRNDGKDYSRHFSEKFINCIINEVRKLPQDITVNIFATTNPMNTVNIIRRVFVNGNRGNIKKLYVYQQNRNGKRIFNSKGKKIY